MEKVLILGASNKPDRYAYLAMKMLEEHQHQVTLVHPNLKEIEGRTVLNDLSLVKDSIDTLTVYVNPQVSDQLSAQILKLKPKRVIFNPGSENEQLIQQLKTSGSEVLKACTLVMLRTGQF